MNLKQVEKTLVKAIKKAKKDGWTIVRGTTYYPPNRECCALGALRACGLSRYSYYEEIATDTLGIEAAQGDAIVAGFDADKYYTGAKSHFYRLGAKLRRQFHVTQKGN